MTRGNDINTQAATRQRIQITMSRDRLTAMMVVSEPRPGEPGITVDEAMAALKSAGVVHGLQADEVARAVADKVYNTPIKVAIGTPPVKGEDTRIEYCFDTDYHGSPKEDADGRIDYRDLHSIQNVERGAVLARRTLPTAGVNGMGVDAKEIPTAQGRNRPFKYGANCGVSSDGLELTATAAGAIVFRNGTVTVKDVVVIGGDVDYRVGNIDCNASVRVEGDIRAGFKLNVEGNLEVGGNVQDCHIICRGNILVKGGCFGGGAGCIHADGNVVIKHAQRQKISSGNDVVVGGELLNCHVTAKERVWVKGRKGTIIGGEITAGKEIRAPFLGSEAGTPTVLVVAFDADLTHKYQEAVQEIERLQADRERAEERPSDLSKLEMDRKLSPAKAVALKQLEDLQKSVPEDMPAWEKKKKGIEETAAELKDAAIIAEDTIYPGVKVYFGGVSCNVTEKRRRCRLSVKADQVIFSDYKPH